MYRTLKILANTIGKPSAAFQALKDQAGWFKAFILIALVSIGTAWAVLPFPQQVEHAKMLEPVWMRLRFNKVKQWQNYLVL